jgi:transcription elongation factor Elf1
MAERHDERERERDDRDRPRRRRDDDDRDRPRQRRNEVNTKVPCPKCGGMSVRSGPWPWYLGTVGAIMCKAVICNECGHEFDLKKPQANLASRKRNLAIGINLVGLIGILAVITLLVLWLMHVMNQQR